MCGEGAADTSQVRQVAGRKEQLLQQRGRQHVDAASGERATGLRPVRVDQLEGAGHGRGDACPDQGTLRPLDLTADAVDERRAVPAADHQALHARTEDATLDPQRRSALAAVCVDDPDSAARDDEPLLADDALLPRHGGLWVIGQRTDARAPLGLVEALPRTVADVDSNGVGQDARFWRAVDAPNQLAGPVERRLLPDGKGDPADIAGAGVPQTQLRDGWVRRWLHNGDDRWPLARRPANTRSSGRWSQQGLGRSSGVHLRGRWLGVVQTPRTVGYSRSRQRSAMKPQTIIVIIAIVMIAAIAWSVHRRNGE